MKSKVNKAEEMEYPCLMTVPGKTTVVLFTEPQKGIVVHPGEGHALGDTSMRWAMECFVPFHESVTLSN